MSNFEDYAGLYSTGHESREPTKPEDEFFHSIYIAGQQRSNHLNIVEEVGKLQIRGVEYNKDVIHFIITHTKQILCKTTRNPQTNRDNLDCFCYQEGQPPWYGTSKMPDGQPRMCGINSQERAANEFCNTCRAQMIVAGLYCDEKGTPYTNNEGKPTLVFLRGKGMKYSGVAEYLNEMSKLELDPLFTPPTEESKRFEKSVVNNKRFVTKVSVTEASSNFGMKKVFKLEQGTQLPNQSVMSILKVAKETLEKFNEKMDWSQRASASGYGAPAGTQIPDTQTNTQPNLGAGQQTIQPQQSPPPAEGQTTQATADNTQQQAESPFSFDDLKF